ncbi:unnamed protein product [Nezara viridula]|uniref:Rad4/PNGase transglutaminase-like fold domain-containing protein n=1 Tax=Nezara viridula TaxID=85310 RepID=A0A9P0H4J1_NEZVI|nr:unnamed protein product [Nezara viridula]
MSVIRGTRGIDMPSTSGYYFVKEGHCSKDYPERSVAQYPQPGPSSRSESQNDAPSTSGCGTNLKKRKWTPRVNDKYPSSLNNDKKKDSKEVMYKDMLLFSRENRIWMHKVNILCLLAYGNRINTIINDDFIKAAMLSLVPCPLIPSGPIDSDYFLDLLEWYRCVFVLSDVKLEGILDYKNFESVFQNRRVICLRDYVMLFVSMLRALGFNARFVMSLQPYPINVDDFEKDSNSSNEDDFDAFCDHLVTLKKGKGFVRSKKGKDLLSPEAVEHLNNPVPISRLEKEKMIMKKYKTVLVEAIKRKNVKLDHWVEVYVEKRWMSVNIIHQTVDEIDSIYENLTLPLKYCLAWTNTNSVQEVTKLYAPDWYKGTSKRRADKLWVDSTFAIFDKRAAKR